METWSSSPKSKSVIKWNFPSETLPLTTIVNLKNPNKSMKNPTLSPSFQNSSQCVSESPDSPNLLFKASSRARK